MATEVWTTKDAIEPIAAEPAADKAKTVDHVLDYHVAVRGLYGRNRTEKFSMHRLARRPVGDPMPDAEAMKLAEAKLAEIRLKTGRIEVRETPVDVEHFQGSTWEVTVCMRYRTISQETR